MLLLDCLSTLIVFGRSGKTEPVSRHCRRAFYDKRLAQEVDGEHLGEVCSLYVVLERCCLVAIANRGYVRFGSEASRLHVYCT